MLTLRQVRLILKPIVFVLCLLPAALVILDAFEITGSLGANPVEAIMDRFGNWALRFILLTLAVTPVRQVTGWSWLQQFRRMFGLFTFFYVLMHFLTWLILDQSLLLSAISEDLVDRPFITLGFTAFVLLAAMTATSTNGMRRRLRHRWTQLHYSAYAVGLLGVWHYWWQVKQDIREPLIYATLLGVLLSYRVWHRFRRRVLQTVQAT